MEAVAFDAGGRELDRARLVVNYGLMNYQAVLVLDAARDGAPRPGRVVWDAILDRRPRRIRLTFDDRPLPVDDRGRFALPLYDPAEIHFLVAELTFPKGLAALFADLAESLRGQRMVWLEGLHFPARVSLTGEAPAGFRLAE